MIDADSRQIEQENNARRMVELGVSQQLAYDELNDPEQAILKATIEHMLSTPSYRQHAEQFAARARELDGPAMVSDVLREYARRLIAY